MRKRSTRVWLGAALICLTCLTGLSSAEELNSADFDHKYSGVDIYDGQNFLNDWSVAGDVNQGDLLDGADITLNASGNIVLTQTPDNRNFWLQQDSDFSPWEEGVGLSSWTLEVRAFLIGTEIDGDLPNDGFVLWGADGIQRGIATIQEDSVQSFGRPGEILDEEDNDDGFHTYRMAYDFDEDLYFIWRDGMLLSEDGILAQAATGNSRLIVGDCCTNANDLTPFVFEELEIEYVRYDLDGVFEPAPDGTTLKAGDANQDLEFNQLDLVQVQIAAKYLTGNPATWGEGDWNGAPGGAPGSPPPGNGLFDQIDIIAALGADVYLTGPYAAIANTPAIGGDTQTSIVYDPSTGKVAVDAPAGVELTSINIDSAAGIFTGDAASNLGGSFDNDADGNIFKATFGSSFGSLSFGYAAQPGLSAEFVAGDLTVVGSLAGGGDLGPVDLIYVPEPESAWLLAIALMTVSLAAPCRRRSLDRGPMLDT